MSETNANEERGRRFAILVRHGHFARPEGTASAHSLFPLSEEGRGQASRAVGPIVEMCSDLGIEIDSRIEASQLLRAWETANRLSASLASETGKIFHVIQRDELIERGLGSATNMRFEQIVELLAADPRIGALPEGWRRMPEFRLPVQGAESLMQAGARVAARISASLESIPDEDPRNLARIFVAHSGCLRHAAVVLGAVDVRTVPELSMDFAQAILIERQSDGDWVHVAGQFRKHLPGA